VLCAVAGALAPVVAPVGAVVIGLPVLAAVGEVRTARRWRTYAKVPWRIALYVHQAIGHAARVFVPLAALGAVVSMVIDVPGVDADLVARILAATALVTLAWFVIARLPFGTDALAPPLRAGRDLVWGALVGGSGRARRPAYALWAAALAGVAVLAADVTLGTSHTLWWPLP
jgi:CTP:molybdopterin cytidylyltransferase MocA